MTMIGDMCVSGVFVCFEPVLTLVANDASPSVRTITAIFPRITFSSIRTVVTRQTAIVAKSVVQTHWKQQNNPSLSSFLLSSNDIRPQKRQDLGTAAGPVYCHQMSDSYECADVDIQCSNI